MDIDDICKDMNKLYLHEDFHIVLLLDSSTSMGPIRDRMIESINHILFHQKKVAETRPGKMFFSLINFDDEFRIVRNNEPILQTRPLTNNEYMPCGGTNLFDSIITTIDYFKQFSRGILIVLSDGEDTSSKYSLIDTQKKIKKFRGNKNWSFLYISTNNEKIKKQGEYLGFNEERANNVNIEFSKLSNGLDFFGNLAIEELAMYGRHLKI